MKMFSIRIEVHEFTSNFLQTAHEAFKKAQDADPSYTPAWVGQVSSINSTFSFFLSA